MCSLKALACVETLRAHPLTPSRYTVRSKNLREILMFSCWLGGAGSDLVHNNARTHLSFIYHSFYFKF